MGNKSKQEKKEADFHYKHPNENTLQMLFDSAGYGLILFDTKGNILQINKNICKITGFSSDELVGMNFEQLLINTLGYENLTFPKVIEHSIHTNKFEHRLKQKEGQPFWGKIIVHPYYEKDEELIGYYFLVEDITDERRNKKFSAILYDISNAVNRTDTSEELIDEIQEALKLFGNTGEYTILLNHENSQSSFKQGLLNEYELLSLTIQSGTLSEYILNKKSAALLTKKNIEELVGKSIISPVSFIPEVWLGIPLVFKQELIGILICQDYKNKDAFKREDIELFRSISGHIALAIVRKKAEEQIKIEKTYFRYLFENAPEAIVIADNRGRIKNVNAEFTRMFRWSPAESIGTDISILLPDRSYHEESVEFISNTFKNRRQSIESIRKRKDGKLIEVSILSTPVTFDENTRMAYFIFRDISSRKESERKLKEAKEYAEEADRLKSAFLANLSHEIRTPLNAIVGFSGLLASSQSLNAPQKEKYINHINTSCDSLVQLIDNLIDISKIEASYREVKKENFKLGDILNELIQIFNTKIKESKPGQIYLKKDYISEEMPVLFTDKIRVRQILYCLLDNAVKFTLKGHVKLSVDYTDKNDISICVTDTGIGIEKANQKKIFERFVKIEDQKNILFRGTGVGLYLAQSLASDINAMIEVNSELNAGSKFILTIPNSDRSVMIADHTVGAPRIKNTDNLADKTILIVEDTQSNYIYLEAVLSHTKANIIWAKTGKQALEYIQSDNKINIVLLDIQLPDYDGFDICRRIREQNINTPIIAQTAYALQDENEKARKIGCNDYLVKPIKPQMLLESIKRFII